jgi:hypothetical protein
MAGAIDMDESQVESMATVSGLIANPDFHFPSEEELAAWCTANALALARLFEKTVPGFHFPSEEELAAWCTANVLALARLFEKTRETSLLPIAGDALEEAGCDRGEILCALRNGRDWPIYLLLASDAAGGIKMDFFERLRFKDITRAWTIPFAEPEAVNRIPQLPAFAPKLGPSPLPKKS